MLGERRSNSLFAPAAPAEPERKPEQAEVHDISFEERTGRSLFAEATTAPRASELFFAPQEKGVTFAEALSQVQGYLSETYATLITEDNSDAKEQMKRRMARYSWQYQIPHRRRRAARYSQMGHRQGNQADLCPCALQSQRVAQRTESPHGAGIDPRLQGATAGAHRTGRQR